jgi:hypothetical protein
VAKYKKTVPIGFIIKDLGPNQQSYTCISNTNSWLDKNYGVDPVLFFEEVSVPCVEPKFARYNIYDTSNYYGYLVCTYIDGFFNIKNAVTSKKILYVYDLNTCLKDERFGQILDNKDVIKIFRCEDYLKKIRSLGFKTNDNIVQDFNIDQILKVIKDN